MAIAFRSASARLKFDVGQSAATPLVPLPPGHVAGDYLMMFVVTDDNTNLTATPAGWTRGAQASVAPSVQTPYYAPPMVGFYARVDNGALGSSVPLSFSRSTWPAGAPWVLAWTVAYSGVEITNPIETWWWQAAPGTGATQAHHSLTTTTANDWLVHVRASSAYAPATFTDSVGTDVMRVDDSA
ncbi:hypothetical protein, partial [Streptomyces sp. NPDC001781]